MPGMNFHGLKMTNYTVTYFRLDTKKHENKRKLSKDMDAAVKSVVDHAKRHSVKLQEISVRLTSEDNGGIQRYCDVCLVSMALYGVKKNWYCKGCKH